MAEQDELIPVSDVPAVIQELTGGRTKVDKRTVYRWLKSGNRGAKLRRVYVGKIAHVKRVWLEQFIADTEPSQEAKPVTTKERTTSRSTGNSLPKWRMRQIEDAQKRAAKMGLVV